MEKFVSSVKSSDVGEADLKSSLEQEIVVGAEIIQET